MNLKDCWAFWARIFEGRDEEPPVKEGETGRIVPGGPYKLTYPDGSVEETNDPNVGPTLRQP